ncbi:YlxR family protein [Kocuria sp. NPDC057446]|uniref:YlxR family protein n=1 Tax=Kocuria sp. NPDC057446 TaxID=3346137 RepID=UPI0036CE6B22
MSADSRRTCIGCRTTEHPDQLVRVVTEPSDDGLRAVVDRSGRLGGRGAWLHPSRECLDSALRRRAFRRAFRAVVDTEAVAPELEALVAPEGSPATGRTSADHSRPRTAARTVRPDR